MNFVEAIYQQVEHIRNDVTSGSSAIALDALDVVTAAIDVYDKYDDAFPIKIAEMLKEAKPALAAISVVCDYALHDYLGSKNLHDKYFSIDIRNKLIRASDKTVNYAFVKLLWGKEKSLKIATCSFSSNVIRLLKLADKRGFELQVYIIDSVWNKKSYSAMLANELNNNTGILSRIITLDDFVRLRKNIDFCIIGADGFDENLNVVNGVPSYRFAQLSSGYSPFYVIAESFKKVDLPHADDGFEYIPNEYISEVCSDDEIW